MMPLKNISSEIGPITQPARNKPATSFQDEGLGPFNNFNALNPTSSKTRYITPAAIPKQADQIKPFLRPGSIFDRESPIAFRSLSIRTVIKTSKTASKQRMMLKANKGETVISTVTNLKAISAQRIAAMDTANVFKVILFASIQGT